MRRMMSNMKINEPTPILAGRGNDEAGIAVILPRHDYLRAKKNQKVKLRVDKVVVDGTPVISAMVKFTGKKSRVVAAAWNSHKDSEAISALLVQDTVQVYICDESSEDEFKIVTNNSMKQKLRRMDENENLDSFPSTLSEHVLGEFNALNTNKIWKEANVDASVQNIVNMSMQELFDIAPKLQTNVLLNLSKQAIEEEDFSEVRKTFMSLRSLRKHAKSSLKIILSGYEDDARKMCLIPEVRRYFESILIMFPEILYYLEANEDSFAEIFSCYLKLTATPQDEENLVIDVTESKSNFAVLVIGMMKYAISVNDYCDDVYDNLCKFFNTFTDLEVSSVLEIMAFFYGMPVSLDTAFEN